MWTSAPGLNVADDLADYPIVVLEADAPEQVGKVGLYDLLMPVGDTGLVFTAAMPGRLYEWGPVFSDLVQRVANLRAATTLVQMGLVRGESLSFIRDALRIPQLVLANHYGVTTLEVEGWQNNTVPIPLHVWEDLAARACAADGRQMPADRSMDPSWRPRLIRVFPILPMIGVNNSGDLDGALSLYGQSMYGQAASAVLLGQECCYPPPR